MTTWNRLDTHSPPVVARSDTIQRMLSSDEWRPERAVVRSMGYGWDSLTIRALTRLVFHTAVATRRCGARGYELRLRPEDGDVEPMDLPEGGRDDQ